MKKTLFLVLAGALAGCGSDSSSSPPTLTTPAEINSYLEGTTWLMKGTNIPPYPMGYNQNMYLASATQCYYSTTIAVNAGIWKVDSLLGTLSGATTLYAIGTCDTNTAVSSTPVEFLSTNVLIENVQGNGTCFDITVTYNGFGQEGRGSISADGKTMQLELYFATKATNMRCADGAVGATGVLVNTVALGGNSVQTYVKQ